MPAIFATIMKRIFFRMRERYGHASIWTEANLKPTLTSTNLFGKPTTLHLRLSEKVANLLKLMHLEEGLPNEGVIPAKNYYEKIEDAEKISSTLIGGGEKALLKMKSQLSQYLIKSIEYEEKKSYLRRI